MTRSKKEIAKLFSIGKFEDIKDNLNDDIIWNVVGENIFIGKNAVLKNCDQIAEYFETVDTNFKTDDILVSDNKVIVLGTAEFIRDSKRVQFISACDVYEFNEECEIRKISSYCVPDKS